MMRRLFYPKRLSTEKHQKREGSVLIFVLWILIVLAALAATVGFRSRIEIQLTSLSEREAIGLYENLSAVNLAAYFIQADEDPFNDSALEPWYGSPAGYARFDISRKITMNVSDEEGKLNLNKVTPEILQNFFKILKKNNVHLDTDGDDLTGSIMAWRGVQALQGKPMLGYEHKRARFETLDELRLIQYITPRDYETLKPYFTVYGSPADFFLKVNINTAHEWVVEAVVTSQPGGDLEKQNLLDRLQMALRRGRDGRDDQPPFAFQAADLSPQIFMDRLGLAGSPQMIQLVNFTLRFFTTDSQYFLVELGRSTDGRSPARKTEVIIGMSSPILVKQPRGGGYGIQNVMNNVLRGYPYEILYWRESPMG